MAGLMDPFPTGQVPTGEDLFRLRQESMQRAMTPGLADLGTAAPMRPAGEPQAKLLFNPVTKEMAAGGRRFSSEDVAAVLQAPQFMQQPVGPDPTGPEWQVVPEESYQRYASSFAERRGVGSLLGLGARQVGEGVIGGTGALMEIAGLKGPGTAVRGFATSLFGQDENEQLRSALIAQNSTLMERIIDGAWQAVPTVAASVVGAGGAALGVRAAGYGATAMRVGAAAGGAAVNFPMHVSSFYEAAVRNGFNPDDPEVKTTILGGAIANTTLDMFGINAVAGKVLSRFAREAIEEAGKQAARGAIRNSLTGAARTGFSEAVTEAGQTFLESVLFDPTVRSQLTASDWTALGPYIAQTYGDDILVAAGAGAILGGGLGGAANFRSTGKLTDNPEDLNSVANRQIADAETKPQPEMQYAPGMRPEELEAAALERGWRGLPDEYGGTPLQTRMSPEEEALAAEWQKLGQPPLVLPMGDMVVPPRARPVGDVVTRSPELLTPDTMVAPPVNMPAVETAPGPARPVADVVKPRRGAKEPVVTPVPEAAVTPAPGAAEVARKGKGAAATPAVPRPGSYEAAVAEGMSPAPGVPTAPAAPAPAPATAAPATTAAPAVPTAPAAPAAPAPTPAAATPRGQTWIKAMRSGTLQPSSAPTTGVAPQPGIPPLPGTTVLPNVPATPGSAVLKGKGKKLSAREQTAQAQQDFDAFIAEEQERQMQKLAAYPKARQFPEIRRFLSAFLDSGSEGMRNISNELAEYTAWLGARTDEEWAKIGTAFTAGDNPYLIAGAMGGNARALAEKTAKFEALISAEPASAPAEGTVRVYRGRRAGSKGAGVGEAAYGIGTYWTSDQTVAERYKGMVKPVTLTGPNGQTVELNRRDTLTRAGVTKALQQIGVEPTDAARKAVSDYVATGTGVLPDGVRVDVGDSEVASTDLDTTAIRPQTAKAKITIGDTTYDLKSATDVEVLRSMGLIGTSYKDGDVTNYVIFPPATEPGPAPTTPTGKARVKEAAATRPAVKPKEAVVRKGPAGKTPLARAEPGEGLDRMIDTVNIRTLETTPLRPRKEVEAALAQDTPQRTFDPFAPLTTKAIEQRTEVVPRATGADVRVALTPEQALQRNAADTGIVFTGEEATQEGAVQDPEVERITEELDDLIEQYRTATTGGQRDAALYAIQTIANSRTASDIKANNKPLYDAYRGRLQRAKAFLATLSEAEQSKAATLYTTNKGKNDLTVYATIEEDLAELELVMMPASAPMKGSKLDAAVDIIAIREDPDTPKELRELAQRILEQNSKTKGVAALSIAEEAYAKARTTTKGSEKLADTVGAPSEVVQLSEMIRAYNDAPGVVNPSWTSTFRRLVLAVREKHPKARYGDKGPLLSNFGKANGDPNFAVVDGTRQLTGGGFMLADWNTINGKVVDLDGKPVTPLAAGRVELAVRTFVSKLARPPRVTVARNQADLKARFPDLYARAVAARPQGDFDTANAMGYSFGNGEVIIFTDRIGTTQQLNFVLAHETLGHFGLRGIMPSSKFDALMEALYELSPAIKTAADAAMDSNQKLSRAEAVEEYLSDYAAVLETSIVARVWKAIETFLNKLGIRTGSEMTRYILDQSRRYVRYGTGVTFDAQTVGQRLHSVETSGDTGRFSTGPKFRDVNILAGTFTDTIGGLPMNIQEGWEYFKGQAINSVESWDKFKATFLSLANFRSRQNPGLFELEKLLDEARNLSMSIKVEYNEKLRSVLNRAVYDKIGGISKQETARINEMLYAAQRYNVAEVRKMKDLGNAPLFRMENGVLVPNKPLLAMLQSMGTRTFKQMRDGFEYDVTYEEAGKTVTTKEKFAGFKDLKEDSREWLGYKKIREAMDDIELRLLKARYQGVLQERDLAFRQIAAVVPDGKLTADETAALTELSQLYGDLYTANVTQDEDGRAKLDPDYQTYANDILRTANSALIGQANDRFEVLRQLLTQPRDFLKGDTDTVRRSIPAAMEGKVADDLIARLQSFKQRAEGKLRADSYLVQNKVKQVILAELANKDADRGTKITIATGYTPVLRKGAYQIRVEAVVGDKVVRLQDSYREQLVYSQFANAAQAMEMADKTNALFGDNEFETVYYDTNKNEYVSGKVKLRAVSEAALDAIAAPPQLNLNEFIRGLRQFDINLAPEKMEDVIVALTKQNSAARNRLLRAFTPGADLDGIMATMGHIESRASTISKIIVRPRLAELMDRSMASTMAKWNGDAEHLAKLKEASDTAAANPNLPREAKADARRTYEMYAYMYNQTNPEGKPRKGNQFYNEAASTVAFLDGNKNVDESDFGAGPMVSRIRAATSMMQLGGSVATGALNILSVYTNGVPYLSSYNAKTGFGGGFSAGKVFAELHRAAMHVGGPGIVSAEMNTAEFYQKVAADPALQKRYGLASHEAAFIAREILDGAMIPAQSNALTGYARGRATSGMVQHFLDKWMWTFNVSEQASRRTFGLTAYRLEYARQIAAGKSEAEAAANAQQFAVQALQFTMGEYSVLNRPPAWRSGIQSFMYMYKVFPTTSVQMFANLSRNGKIGMIAGLWLLTGLSGLPFAEDLEDVLDTLAQKLGLAGWQGTRYETAKFIDGIFPGMSPYFLKGIVNQFLPADIAGRTSLGDLLPATDVLLAGADVSRGISEIAGPAPSMLLGTAKFATDLMAAPFSSTVTLETAAREAPITMVRALTDAYAYTQAGAIVDRRGYTVSPDMTVGTVLARALGFYPVEAANQYELIRMATRMTDYQREMVTAYRTAWVSAMARGDREAARSIEDSVKAWNASAKGTALEIRDFVDNSRRALKEARRPAAARTLRSAPDAAEKDLQRMMDLMTMN